MDRHQSLYKNQWAVLSPRNTQDSKREKEKAARANRRKDQFQNNRMISISPTPIKLENGVSKEAAMLTSTPAAGKARRLSYAPPLTPCFKEELDQPKENEEPPTREEAGTVPKPPLTHREMYLQRFMKWKAANKKAEEQKKAKKRQLQPLAGNSQPAASSVQAVATTNTSKTFRPPANLKSMAETQAFKRRSLYIVQTEGAKEDVPICPATPDAAAAAVPIVPKKLVAPPSKKTVAPPVKSVSKPMNAIKKAVVSKSLKTSVPPVSKPVALIPPAAVKPWTVKKTLPNTLQAEKKPAPVKLPVKSLPKPAVKQPPAATAAKPVTSVTKPVNCAPKQPPPPNLMMQPFAKPPNPVKPNIVKPIRGGGGGGAASKFHQKKAEKAPFKDQLTKRMKVAKKDSSLVKATKSKGLLESINTLLAPQTPLEPKPFVEQTTSTQTKSENSSLEMFDGFGNALSPVAATNSRTQRATSASRQLLMASAKKDKNRKFNFVFSEANSMLEASTVVEATLKEKEVEETMKPQTPPSKPQESESQYLSPFVSVSRGKVNSRAEREKRNSMYLQEDNQDAEKAGELSLEQRRSLEAVKHFRLQLSNEIDRLHSLCSEWEGYAGQNEAKLVETGGMDMINVTVGQTRLLTSKKMMQFKGLIDRCEAGVTGVGAKVNDGSEDTKPVQAADLEGWWDMLRLQSENIDKRFENLGRWRKNDWLDPDARAAEVQVEVTKPKAKPKLSKNLKAKAKPKSNFKDFLSQLQKQKKQAEEVVNGSTVEKRRSQRSIVVLDRKSFSPARTVIRKSIGKHTLTESGPGPRPSIGAGASKLLLKSAILGAVKQERRDSLCSPQRVQQPPLQTPRKSILKTPGTAKRSTRGVLFSAQKKVRKFQFIFDENEVATKDDVGASGVDKLEDFEEDMSLDNSNGSVSAQEEDAPPTSADSRVYSLRNRRVKLRPSATFMTEILQISPEPS